ncbi:helix-turn-helix domain-containing protein [Bradyrhizobium sp. CCBAU 11361]|uniref:helix-turn-helix domain-containing protein n=1 Tax=Bradyrhizobium sp. CCBAU 11361 TaxID=1630812 RepID=UPI0023030ABB|nr:AraC family transcriptional regulator [Bradyrhizobium sp. CCBAU 11361]
MKGLRLALAEICDLNPLTPEEDFHFTSRTRMTSNALLVESLVSDVEYDRTPAHIARGGMDHYQVTLCLEGEMRFRSGRREVTLTPGDIILLDMGQPNRTVLRGGGSRTHLRAIILQRSMLAPRLAHPNSATATLLPSHHPHARLLANHFAALALSPEPEADPVEATIEAMANIIAAAAGGAAKTAAGVERAERHLYLAMIKRHIAGHLTDALTTDELCGRFQISRATLYRLFEADGGRAHYVSEQRLNFALRLMISSAAQDKRLIDLAVELHFSSDSTFIRAFRRKFGVTPGELREMYDTWLRETGAVPAFDTVLHQLARRSPS